MTYDLPEDRITFLLGAGASAPAPSSIPTVANLLPELWRRARKVGRDDIDRLADWCNKREIGNIEDLLTAAYIANFAAKNNALTQLIDYFFTGDRSSTTEGLHRVSSRLDSKVNVASIALIQDTLQTLFGLLACTMIPAQPNAEHDAIVNFVAKHKKTAIVTTNYDGCIDEAFSNHKVVLRTYLEERIHDDHEGLDLIKIHGSINWTYCDSCQEVKEFKLDKLKDSYEKDTLSYPVIGICRACGGQR